MNLMKAATHKNVKWIRKSINYYKMNTIYSKNNYNNNKNDQNHQIQKINILIYQLIKFKIK